MYDELDKGFVLLTDVCIDSQVFFLSLSIGHIGILRGFDGTLEHSIIVLPTLLILEVATGSNDAVDIALEVTQLVCDLRAFCKPGNINLTVGDIKGFDFGSFLQRAFDGIGILDLLPSCNTCQRAVGEFVLGGSCFLVTTMEYIIVEGWCQTTGSNLLNGYLIHLCSIVIVGDIRLRINFKY